MSTEGSQESTNGLGCAACKYQRRKCSEICALRPYFGVKRMDEFLSAQKIFGISNMTKMIKRLPREDRPMATDSIVWEASLWKQDPVNGPLGQYKKLQQELELLKYQVNQLNQNQQQQQQQQQILPYTLPTTTLGLQGSMGDGNGIRSNNNECPTNYGYSSENSGFNLPVNINMGLMGLPSNNFPTPLLPNLQGQDHIISQGRYLPIARSCNILQKQDSLGFINGHTPSYQPTEQQQQRENQERNSQAAFSYVSSANNNNNNQGRSFYEHGQATVVNNNTSFVHGNQIGDFYGPRPAAFGKVAAARRDIRCAPYHYNQLSVLRHDLIDRRDNSNQNLNSQRIHGRQQLPNGGQQLPNGGEQLPNGGQQLHGSRSCSIQDRSCSHDNTTIKEN